MEDLEEFKEAMEELYAELERLSFPQEGDRPYGDPIIFLSKYSNREE